MTTIENMIIDWINQETHNSNLVEKSTREVATKFNISTIDAYKLCSTLAKKRLFTKLDPVQYNMKGDNFLCCGWIRNED